jgi:cardiolipin synthase
MTSAFPWGLAAYIAEWIIRLIMLVVVPRQRKPTSAMAWLLVIFFQPWIGFVLYLLIGTMRLPQRRIARHSQLMQELRGVQRRWEHHPHIAHPELDEGQKATVVLAERLGQMPILGGNHVEIMTDTDTVINRLIADIDSAQRQVHLLFYIFAADATGRRVAEALARAVKRGVKCRLLCDAVASRPMLRRFGHQMVRDGIDVRADLPVHLLRRQFSRVDMRNHRKIAVIDGTTAYAGSQNIVDASYGHKDLAWHDMMVRLTGPIVLELQAVFVSDWYFAANELLPTDEAFLEPQLSGNIMVQALPSGPNYPTENYQCLIVAALHGSHRHVVITTPYLIPDEAFFQAIQTAVLRGVEVQIIVPKRCDQILVGAASRGYYSVLLDAGVKLYLHQDGLLHAKTMTIDDSVAFIGSSNFDIRSFALNFEINLIFYGQEMSAALRREQNQYLANSIELTPAQWRARPAWRQAVLNIARLLSPLL